MYRPILVTAPASPPLDAADVKTALGITGSSQDALITILIDAALSVLDGWTGILGRCLMPQTWRQDYSCFEYCLRLPLYPVEGIGSVKYDDSNNVEQTIASGNYTLLDDDLGAYVHFIETFSFPSLMTLPQRPGVRVEYDAGYPDEAAVPGAIKQAIILMVHQQLALFANSPFLARISIPGVIEKQYIVSDMSQRVMETAIDNLIGPFRRTRF